MFGHLGAKVGEQGRKMRQLSEKVGFLEAWRGEGVTQVHATDLGYPPLRNSKEGAGAPTSTWSSQLHLETRRTQAVDGALYRPGHATCA